VSITIPGGVQHLPALACHARGRWRANRTTPALADGAREMQNVESVW
jgi:hypothetical protein